NERRALQREDVDLAVDVVVEQGDTRPDDLGVIELPAHAVRMLEADTGRLRRIDEELGGRFGWGRGAYAAVAAAGEKRARRGDRDRSSRNTQLNTGKRITPRRAL